MKTRLSRAFNIAALLWLGAMAFLLIPSFFAPQFDITNRAGEPVRVTALWQQNEKDLGRLVPAESISFRVTGEAAMVFRGEFPEGGSLESEPVYFSRGIRVAAIISDQGIETRYPPRGNPLDDWLEWGWSR